MEARTARDETGRVCVRKDQVRSQIGPPLHCKHSGRPRTSVVEPKMPSGGTGGLKRPLTPFGAGGAVHTYLNRPAINPAVGPTPPSFGI